jgi:hypothetical protein
MEEHRHCVLCGQPVFGRPKFVNLAELSTSAKRLTKFEPSEIVLVKRVKFKVRAVLLDPPVLVLAPVSPAPEGKQMAYEYTQERTFVFTEDGIKMLLAIRDKSRELLKIAGAFREQEAIACVSGDSWHILACVDYLVERGEIRRVCANGARQHNVYVAN